MMGNTESVVSKNVVSLAALLSSKASSPLTLDESVENRDGESDGMPSKVVE